MDQGVDFLSQMGQIRVEGPSLLTGELKVSSESDESQE